MAEAAFGRQLRECRQAVGLSLRQLAGRVGYDHSYLSQVERGQRPGSADLARLCDRELDTGNQLASSYEQAQRRVVPAAQRAGSVRTTAQIDSSPASADTMVATGIAALEPIEAAWHGLVGALGGVEGLEEGDALAGLEDWRSVPPTRLLPELVAEFQALRGHAPAVAAVRRAQLSTLIAVTLTALGQLRGARRWWRASRLTADSSGEMWARSLVRAREVVSGLVERRRLPELLQMADEAVELSTREPDRPGCAAQAHAARAEVLAELSQAAEAHRALQELVSVADRLPMASTSASVADWAAYDVHSAEGRVYARLGYGAPGCVLLARALELCPAEWVGERAGVEMGLAECLVVDGEVAAGTALAMRVLVELPDEWHSYHLYDAGERVLSVVRETEPGLPAARDLQELLARRAYLGGRSVGSGSRYGVGRE